MSIANIKKKKKYNRKDSEGRKGRKRSEGREWGVGKKEENFPGLFTGHSIYNP